MANQEEEAEKKKIAVLTVTKSNAILKNIFLILTTDTIASSSNVETTLVVGRHPYCDIVLSHPSISRFHLRLSRHSRSDSLVLLDLSSVHGTWVNGKKIEPNVRVELNEGDMIRIGGSSRVYSLHWVPLSRAYDTENSFISPSDVYVLAEAKDHEGIYKDESGLFDDINQPQLLDGDTSEESDDEVSNEKLRLFINNEIPLEPLISDEGAENRSSSNNEPEGGVIPNSFAEQLSTNSVTSPWLDQILSETEVQQFSPDKKSSRKLGDTESEQNLNFLESLASLSSHENRENPCLENFILLSEYDVQQLDKENESQDENIDTPPEKKSTLIIDHDSDIQQLDKENESQDENIDTPPEKKSTLIIDHETRTGHIIFSEKLGTEAETSYIPSEIPLETENLLSEFDFQQLDKQNESQEENITTPLKNKNTSITDHEKRTGPSIFSEKFGTEAEISPLRIEIPLETEYLFSEYDIQQLDKENESQEENIATPLKNKNTSITDHEKRTGPSIFSEKLGTEAEISPLCSEIPLETEYLFSEYDIQQLDKENETLEENIATPESINTSMSDLEKRMGPSIFSEKLGTEAEISSFPCKIPLEAEILYSEVDIQQMDKENESQEENSANSLEETNSSIIDQEKSHQCAIAKDTQNALPVGSKQNADPEESLASLFSHDYYEQSSMHDVKLLTEVDSQEVNKENGSEKRNMATPLLNLEKHFSSCTIWSRRSKSSSALTIQIGRSREKGKWTALKVEGDLYDPGGIENIEVTKSPLTGLDAGEEALSGLDSSEEVCTPDKENFTPTNLRPCSSSSLKIKEKMSKNLFTDWSENSEQYTPDKENITPNTLLVRSMAKRSTMKDINGSNFYISSSSENVLSPSIEKNPAEKLLQRQKITRSCSRSHKISKLRSGMKNSTKGVPFQSLFEHTRGTSQSEASSLSSTTKICNTKKYAAAIEVKQNVKEYKRKWHMVVDATCLLKKESRKTLELLRGLKGTQITIPRFVIRELDTLNKQGSLFRRTNEAACALQWIEECMASTDWWIHVQSTEEEPMIIPPTPPVTESQFSKVYRRFSGGIANSVFSSWESFFEIVTPKAEDHVLECALQFRKNTSDAQFVLLSNNVNLKIKAMAEGLICETAEEFRESLVNPFSDRFLWSDSSPRGLTWSCADDVILKERFYGHYMKLVGGEAGMGLKLLLAIAT